MPKGTHNPPKHILPFFTPENYTFSTHEPGRKTTFYFRDGHGNLGRYRRVHSNGELLAYQGECKRVFLSQSLVNSLYDKARFLWMKTRGKFDLNIIFHDLCKNIYPILASSNSKGDYSGKASLQPKIGWHVFDSNGTMSHCSGGTVLKFDEVAHDYLQINSKISPGKHAGPLAEYNGPWWIW